MARFPILLLTVFVALPAAGEGAGDIVREGKAGLDLRYRFENVEQDDKPEAAAASTLRIRLDLTSGEIRGFSGFLELDHVEAIGHAYYDDTRNGLVEYPVVADPEGTDLNQAWLQYRGAKDADIYLASPATVACPAIAGRITDPREFAN